MNPEKKRIVINRTKPVFTHEQKAGFMLVIVTGCIAILLGGFYIFRHIAKPFFVEYTGEYYLTQDQADALEMQEQQQKDTDSDGIVDYDELYVYGTSPYLMDTDGDGYTDKTEVENGTDPNCPAGEVCIQDTIDTGASTIFDEMIASQESPDVSFDEIQEAIHSLTAIEIRDLLVTAGADQELIDGLTDEEIEALYYSVVYDLEESGEFEQFLQQIN